MSSYFTHQGNVAEFDNWDDGYQKLLAHTLSQGALHRYRQGSAYSLFGATLDIDQHTDFPVLRLRDMQPGQKIWPELIANLGFSTNINDYADGIRPHWQPYVDERGEGGASLYARAFRKWPQSAQKVAVPNEQLVTHKPVDQIARLIKKLRHKAWTPEALTSDGWEEPQACGVEPTTNDRQSGVLVLHNPTAYNVAQPTCHTVMHFTVAGDGTTLNMFVAGRSQDAIVGLPGDLPRFCALHQLIAIQTGYDVGRFCMTLSDLHVYECQLPMALRLMHIPPAQPCHLFFDTNVKSLECLSKLQLDDFYLRGYDPADYMKPVVPLETE